MLSVLYYIALFLFYAYFIVARTLSMRSTLLKIFHHIVYTYNGMLFSLEREGNPAIHDDMNDLEDILLSDLSQSQEDRCCTIPLTW